MWLFGFLSYDLKNELEKLNSQNEDGLGFPGLSFFEPEIRVEVKNQKVKIEGEDSCGFKKMLQKLEVFFKRGEISEIRSRISSVSSTMQITQAMKMVSAAKLKKAQSAVVSMRPYSENLFSIITDILNTMPGYSSPLVGEKISPKRLLIRFLLNNINDK